MNRRQKITVGIFALIIFILSFYFVGAVCSINKITGPMKAGNSCDYIH